MVVRKIKRDPPDPNAQCICGGDGESGVRYSIVCPKHDAVYYEVEEEVRGSNEHS